MNQWPANDEITLAHGSNTVALRPSLRAATILEQLHGGFPALLNKVKEFDTSTIQEIILIAAPDRAAAQRLINTASRQPLAPFANTAYGPIFELCAALMLTSTGEETKGTSTGTPQPWAEVYRELYRIAAGWLGWTPEQAWQATPREIAEAYQGHTAKLNAIYGASDSDDQSSAISKAQRQSNIEQGLDPEFDRAGLHALKDMGKL